MILIFDYLTNRKQRTEIDFHFNLWKELLFRVLQRSSLGHLMLSICYYDPFLLTSNIEIASYAYCAVHLWRNYKLDHRVTGKHLDLIFQWFSDNGINDNYKCHYFFFFFFFFFFYQLMKMCL